VTRSAGEILLALAALCAGAVALIVGLDDGDGAGPLRAPIAVLVARLEGQATVVTALALLVGLILASILVLAIRARDEAAGRAERLARDLARSREQVERLESALAGRDDALLAVVHELRTPLTHVVGYAELLGSSARPRRPEEIGEMSAAIQSASTTMLRLMDDLVETTRARAGGFSLKTRPFDLAPLIRGAVAGYEARRHAPQGTQAHRFTLHLPGHWLTVIADPVRVHQVVANLLTNAISYSPDGGEIQISARQHGDQVRVEIADRGIGMSPEEQRRAFDRFYRTSGGRAVRRQGSGLGLAIVKGLVEAHGGDVGVSSQPGLGSTFWFTLPAAEERAASAETRLVLPRRAQLPRGA
jgi:signal transduction histidine kinase